MTKQLLKGHAHDENPDEKVNSSDPNVTDDQVGSSHVSTVMPNQPALPRAGSHGVALCSAAWSLWGVRRSCGTRQGESLADCWGSPSTASCVIIRMVPLVATTPMHWNYVGGSRVRWIWRPWITMARQPCTWLYEAAAWTGLEAGVFWQACVTFASLETCINVLPIAAYCICYRLWTAFMVVLEAKVQVLVQA